MSKMIVITLLAILFSLVLIQIAYCVPVLDAIQQFEQPDGTACEARRWGMKPGLARRHQMAIPL